MSRRHSTCSRRKCAARYALLFLVLASAPFLNSRLTSSQRASQKATVRNSSFAGGGLVQSGSSCEYFDIYDIQRIGMMPIVANPTELAEVTSDGHFPYSACPKEFVPLENGETQALLENLAVLTVIDSNYIEVLPSWAEQVLALRLQCFVMAVDDKVCEVVLSLGCQCFPSGLSQKNLVRTTGWHENRIHSVKQRFDGALRLLSQGLNVLMHDADVLFREGGLRTSLQYWSQYHENHDFMVQDNGFRKVNYDGLNWGFVFMRSSSSSISLLRCTLDRWDDAAFGCGKKNCEGYYLRSQPRINHILELALQSTNSLRVCKLPALSNLGAVHMTGYPTVAAKLACAKAAGYLFDPSNTRLAYDVPSAANVSSQREALQIAVLLADMNKAKLEIPKAFVSGEEQDFCRLFDVSRISSTLSPSSGACANVTDHITPEASLMRWPRHAKRICLSFHELLLYTSDTSGMGRSESPNVPVCDPKNEIYDKIHCCERKDGSDEEGLSLT